ncbi:hypothetical protein BJX63DRAFT_242617 [Aspergillus granulosus]|uniref:Uncharacterized protein n=1 Tax=Aspergillus granulosus TaxID=176169 RepID=A0ABR4HAN1_9EURO
MATSPASSPPPGSPSEKKQRADGAASNWHHRCSRARNRLLPAIIRSESATNRAPSCTVAPCKGHGHSDDDGRRRWFLRFPTQLRRYSAPCAIVRSSLAAVDRLEIFRVEAGKMPVLRGPLRTQSILTKMVCGVEGFVCAFRMVAKVRHCVGDASFGPSPRYLARAEGVLAFGNVSNRFRLLPSTSTYSGVVLRGPSFLVSRGK